MNTWLTDLVTKSNGRPFTAEEEESIAIFVESLPDRLAAVKKLEESQKWLAKQLSDFFANRASELGLPKEPFTNDFVQLLTSLSCSVLAGDNSVLDTYVLEPIINLSDALDLPYSEFSALFSYSWDLLSKKIDPKATIYLMPAFLYCIHKLRADFDQPSEKTLSEADTLDTVLV